MNAESKIEYRAVNDLFSVISSDQPGLRNLLQRTARHFDAFGCILWEAISDSRLCMLGCWFPDEAGDFAIHDLPVSNTVSGNALSSGAPVHVVNVQTDGGDRRDHVFLVKNDIGPLCSVPVTFTDGRKGTLDLLRLRCKEAFTVTDVEHLLNYSPFIPMAYQAILDRRNYELVLQIDRIIQGDSLDDLKNDRPVQLQCICESVSKSLQAIETSLFLMNPMKDRECWQLKATTWDGPFERSEYVVADSDKTKTGWIIKNKQPVLLFDLNRADPESEDVQKKYPGLWWKRFDQFFQTVVERLLLPERPDIPREDRDDLPPLSYIAAPVFRNRDVIGVIRCCGSFKKNGPGFFSDRDLNLLNVVAGQISRQWNSYITQEESLQSAETLRRLAAEVQGINSFVHESLAGDTSDPEYSNKLLPSVLAKSLQSLSKVVPEATAIDIRQLTLTNGGETGELRFTHFFGKGWVRDGHDISREIAASNTFPVDMSGSQSAPRSLGEQVIRLRSASRDSSEHPSGFQQLRQQIMPDCRHTYCAPIVSDKRIYGVLDILTFEKNRFSRQAEIAGQVLGSQLALYFSLFEKIDALEVLKRDVDETYEDLAHQLKGPVAQAYWRCCDLIEKHKKATEIDEKELFAVRGLCQKSLMVMRTLAFLRDIGTASLTYIDTERLRKLIGEMAYDYERTHYKSGTLFYLDKSWYTCRLRKFQADESLLPQVISVVCDNAMKYSFPQTQVEVSVEQAGEHLQVTFANKGIPMSTEDTKDAIKRGWRGKKAKLVTAEGRGIGLYLCDSIMRAMGGVLRIEPTDRTGINRVRLLFLR